MIRAEPLRGVLRQLCQFRSRGGREGLGQFPKMAFNSSPEGALDFLAPIGPQHRRQPLVAPPQHVGDQVQQYLQPVVQLLQQDAQRPGQFGAGLQFSQHRASGCPVQRRGFLFDARHITEPGAQWHLPRDELA